jgi:hypothetical protein
MSGFRTTILAAAALAASTLGFAQISVAEGAPASPDYLYQLPERQWAIGGTLAGQRTDCGADACEAGYRSGDLVLSVRRNPSQIQAVAGVRGCNAVGTRVVPTAALQGKSPWDQYTLISRAALLAAGAARTQCGSGVMDLIDTQALVRIVPGQSTFH